VAVLLAHLCVLVGTLAKKRSGEAVVEVAGFVRRVVIQQDLGGERLQPVRKQLEQHLAPVPGALLAVHDAKAERPAGILGEVDDVVFLVLQAGVGRVDHGVVVRIKQLRPRHVPAVVGAIFGKLVVLEFGVPPAGARRARLAV